LGPAGGLAGSGIRSVELTHCRKLRAAQSISRRLNRLFSKLGHELLRKRFPLPIHASQERIF
jgi:hypothetical protein